MARKLRSGFHLYYTLLVPIYPLEWIKSPLNSSSDFLYLTSILQLSKNVHRHTYTHTHANVLAHTHCPPLLFHFFMSVNLSLPSILIFSSLLHCWTTLNKNNGMPKIRIQKTQITVQQKVTGSAMWCLTGLMLSPVTHCHSGHIYV